MGAGARRRDGCVSGNAVMVGRRCDIMTTAGIEELAVI